MCALEQQATGGSSPGGEQGEGLWGLAQVGEQREKEASEGTAFPSCLRKLRERRSCVRSCWSRPRVCAV